MSANDEEDAAPAPAAAASEPKRRRWTRRRLLLIGSLLINAVFIAMLLGALFHRGPPPGPRGPRDLPELPAALRATRDMGPEGHALRRGAFDNARPELRALSDRIAELRQELRDLVAAEPFDRAAFDSLLAELLALVGERRAALGGVAGEVLEQGGPAVRERFVEKYDEILEHIERRRREREERIREREKDGRWKPQ